MSSKTYEKTSGQFRNLLAKRIVDWMPLSRFHFISDAALSISRLVFFVGVRCLPVAIISHCDKQVGSKVQSRRLRSVWRPRLQVAARVRNTRRA